MYYCLALERLQLNLLMQVFVTYEMTPALDNFLEDIAPARQGAPLSIDLASNLVGIIDRTSMKETSSFK